MSNATERAKALLAGITDGEWKPLIHPKDRAAILVGGRALAIAKSGNDAAFIAAAPSLVRGLCEEVEKLENQVAAYQFMLGNKKPESVSEGARQINPGHGRFA